MLHRLFFFRQFQKFSLHKMSNSDYNLQANYWLFLVHLWLHYIALSRINSVEMLLSTALYKLCIRDKYNAFTISQCTLSQCTLQCTLWQCVTLKSIKFGEGSKFQCTTGWPVIHGCVFLVRGYSSWLRVQRTIYFCLV